ncbi:AURKAIP1/COX24 domain-containing protein [Thermodesulfovibrio thiophilus]|nr:AURKAIP1/COX24 domain-containing protein [Thermodesulfovibrio thiophilus]
MGNVLKWRKKKIKKHKYSKLRKKMRAQRRNK